MKKFIAAAMLASAIAATGCASTGNEVLRDETRESVAEKLRPGMSQSEVTSVFGEPLETNFTDSGNEIWKYQFSKGKMTAESFIPYASASKADVKTLTIFFDTSGRVVRHAMSNSKVRSKGGIIG